MWDVTSAVDVRSYGDLQEKLRSMSYIEPVGIESVALVQRLLNDFLTVSDAREKLEKALAKAQREALELSQILLPLRKENAKLTRENNSLHLEIIQQEESISEREKASEVQVDTLRDEVKRLQFLSNQQAQLLQQKEQDMVKLQGQLERAIAAGAGAGAKNPQRALNSSRIEVKGGHLSAAAVKPTTDRVSTDKTDREVITSLEDKVQELSTENRTLAAECESLVDKIAHREKEIERLSKLSLRIINDDDESAKMLRETDSKYEKEALQRAADLQLEQLSAQVDFLSAQVAKYELRLKEANAQIRRNDRLGQRLIEAENASSAYASELKALQSKFQELEAAHSCCNTDERRDSSPEGIQEPTTEPVPSGTSAEKLLDLENQVAELKRHKDRLEDALRATHYDKLSYTNALSHANSHNRMMSSDLSKAEAKLKELSSKNERLNMDLVDVRGKMDSHTREAESLREALRQAVDAKTLEMEKNSSLHRELRSIDKALTKREDECRALNHTVSIQKNELQRLNEKIQSLHTRAMELDSEDARGGRAKALMLQEKKWLEEERQELRKSREELVMKTMKLEEELQTTKAALHDAKQEASRLQEEVELIRKSEEGAQQVLTAKKDEVARYRLQLSEKSEQLRQLQDQYTELQVIVIHAEKTETQKVRLANELLELKRRIEELRDENAGLKCTIENSESQVRKLLEQNKQAQADRLTLEQQKSTTEQDHVELRKNYENALVELRNARQTSNHYQNEYEKLVNELQTKSQSLTTEQSSSKATQLVVQELQKKLGHIQHEMSLKQNALLQAESRLEQEKVANRSAQGQLDLAQNEILQVRQHNQSLEAMLAQLRSAMKDNESELTEKSESVENYKMLLEQVESSKEQTTFKLKQMQQRIQQMHLQEEDMQVKITKLEKELLLKSTELTSLKKLTKSLDDEKDEFHNQLDLLTERYHELLDKNKQLLEDVKSKVSSENDIQQRLTAAIAQLNDKDEQLASIQAECTKFQDEIERLRHTNDIMSVEMRALTQDLENMTIENQALSEECSRLQFAQQKKDQSVQHFKQNSHELERTRDSLQIELDDLRHTYRSLVQEHQKLQESRTEVSELHDELTSANEHLRKTIETLEKTKASLQQKIDTLTTESATYREQVSFLTEKLRQSEEQLDESEYKHQQLRDELEQQKSVATEISAQRYGVEAQRAAVSQRIVHLEAKLSNSKFELKTLRDKVNAEQTQRRSLEDLVATLRQKLAANDTVIAHLEEQREAMADEIRAAHQRLVTSPAMDMTELMRTPSNHSNTPQSLASSVKNDARSNRSSAPSSTGNASPDGVSGDASTSSILPIRALQDAQRKCKELEDRLANQDDTIRHLERSRSKFKKFAAKYEKEIEQRDKMIQELRNSRGSSASSRRDKERRMDMSGVSSSGSSASSSSHLNRQEDSAIAT
ncbi:TPA: hypothetical protein N0F65_000666 [Lagenidium giganteum]|uniref:Centrosomal protein of 135 kDa n=1 Tax=Lagenidium giganteum TaxID=4803 RepID=A0AAV2YS06_9STRA|nr:TPA: hypothetical protein N0F65_000666 [Lagenidium giganteum]